MSIDPSQPHTLTEIAAHVRAVLTQKDMTYRDAARSIAAINGKSLRSVEAQVSMAMSDPNKRPGTIRQLVEVVTPYTLSQEPLYVFETKPASDATSKL